MGTLRRNFLNNQFVTVETAGVLNLKMDTPANNSLQRDPKCSFTDEQVSYASAVGAIGAVRVVAVLQKGEATNSLGAQEPQTGSMSYFREQKPAFSNRFAVPHTVNATIKFSRTAQDWTQTRSLQIDSAPAIVVSNWDFGHNITDLQTLLLRPSLPTRMNDKR